MSSTGGGGEEECASVSGCTLLDCSACKHVGCNQQALHSLQSPLSGAAPVGHAKWHTLTDHLPHNSSGLQEQEVRQKLWGLPLTKQCNSTPPPTHTLTQLTYSLWTCASFEQWPQCSSHAAPRQWHAPLAPASTAWEHVWA